MSRAEATRTKEIHHVHEEPSLLIEGLRQAILEARSKRSELTAAFKELTGQKMNLSGYADQYITRKYGERRNYSDISSLIEFRDHIMRFGAVTIVQAYGDGVAVDNGSTVELPILVYETISFSPGEDPFGIRLRY